MSENLVVPGVWGFISRHSPQIQSLKSFSVILFSLFSITAGSTLGTLHVIFVIMNVNARIQ